MVIFKRGVIGQKMGFWPEILGFSYYTLLIFVVVLRAVLKVLGLVLKVVGLDEELYSESNGDI